jgi:undecaprenyl-diphosphatase
VHQSIHRFLPLAVLGLLFGSKIKAALFNPISSPSRSSWAVSSSCGPSGASTSSGCIASTNSPRLDAVKLGLFQALALIPGHEPLGS